MERKHVYIFLGILGFLIVLFIILVAIQSQPTAPTDESSVQPGAQENSDSTNQSPNEDVQSVPVADLETPEKTAKGFYDWYVAHPNPLKSGAYKARKELASEYKKQVEYVSGVKPQSDPVICKDNKVIDTKVTSITYDPGDEKAIVIIGENTPPESELHRFFLNKVNENWLITDVNCIGRP